MITPKRPVNDDERLANVLAAWCSPENDAYESDDEALAEAEARGVDLAAWADALRAKAQAQADAERGATAEEEPPDFEALLRAEVERSVASYVGVVPPYQLAKLRELAERYWREHPEASRILRLLYEKRSRTVSGNSVTVAQGDEDEAAVGERRK